MADQLHVSRAEPSDLDALMGLLTEVRLWLASKGYEGQWPPVIPRDFIAATIDRGEVYLAFQGEHLVGTVTLQWDDPHIWGKRSPNACYVHRLAVRRSHAGQGTGLALLRWAERFAVGHGKRFLRLDCWADNPHLVRYYADAGFRQCGEVTVGSWKGALFQRTLAPSPWE